MADMPEPVDPTPSGELPASGQPAPEAPAPADPLEVPPLDDESRRAIEAVLMVAEHPVEVGILAQLVERSTQQVEDLLGGLAASYEEDGRGFELVRVAGGWRFQSHADLSPYVERFILGGQTARLSAAALETLAIVAYKQPISRAQVSAIRGVNVDGVVRTLQQRGYIAEVGKDPGPGQPSMFGTTSLFLERLGLDSIEELPSLGDFIPGADVVELLEHGLRVTPDETLAEGAAPDGSAPDGAASDWVASDLVASDGAGEDTGGPLDRPAVGGSPDDIDVVIDLDELTAEVSGVDPTAGADEVDDLHRSG